MQKLQTLPQVDVVAIHREPARSGAFGTWPQQLDSRLLAALQAHGLERPYTHQSRAIDAALAGRDVVLSTSTASGKSLAYQVPILQSVLSDSKARALMMFPTKALGRDQVEALRTMASGIEGAPVGVSVYDGDTPPDERRAARRKAHVIATNPDMLHRGMLPHHEGWASVLAGLRYVVLDELHTYRGVFGAHVANVLRRLLRLCSHYGSSPTFVASSATIANPAELFMRLTGRPASRPPELLDASGAPSGPRTTIVLNPKVVDPLTGVRRDAVKVTRAVSTVLREAAVPTLVFCRTRKAVELLTRYMQDDARADRRSGKGGKGSSPSAIRGYRGGYLPDRRREVESALRTGEATLVAATNALELGIDIGGIDAVVLSGYPGTRAATVQRLGRAGRRHSPALGVVCLNSSPLDQFVAVDASFLWGKPPEHARVDPDNPDVLLPHLRCAAHEQAFVGSDLANVWSGLPEEDLRDGLEYLTEHGALVRAGDGDTAVYTAQGGEDPSAAVAIRGPIEENFTVIDQPTGDILAEVDFEDAPLYLHPGAIYTVEGRTHEVVDLQWEPRKAYVRHVEADYYTEAISNTNVRVIDPGLEASESGDPVSESGAAKAPRAGQGLAHLMRQVPGFKKIRFGTHENIGFGPIALPDLELHTIAAYWAVPDPPALEGAPRGDGENIPGAHDPVQRAATALAVAHALRHVAAMVLMCDSGDLGHVLTAGHPGSWGPVIKLGRKPSPGAVLHAASQPYIVLYDRTPGGTGLASAAHELGASLLERAQAVVSSCGCEQGCPTCMGPSSDEAWEVSRGHVISVFEAMRAQCPQGLSRGAAS
ncbi:MAG: DEAD/DEAH box helicase [Nannocystaceae bacterium]|nr:DEAD/DEAH box helicase [Nannocystaceae bacterium]